MWKSGGDPFIEKIQPLSASDKRRMNASADVLSDALRRGDPVYGVTRGFGPLAEYEADDDGESQGLGLINHLSAGQGAPLDLETTRLMLRLRLEGMRKGYSGISVDRWVWLAHAFNEGFVPVVPSRGSVSASGDLIPLAHAAAAFSGRGSAWGPPPNPAILNASIRLEQLGLQPLKWRSREALAFVNGTSASTAICVVNSDALRRQAWSIAALTGILVDALNANAEPYARVVGIARGGSKGHETAAGWIREHIREPRNSSSARQLQEPYSLRCAPQVLGSVLDSLDSGRQMIDVELTGCSDNPVVSSEGIFHGGNFYAITAGLLNDQQAVLAHQIAFIAERQLALLLNPQHNGGLNPLLAENPGMDSGLAGLQLSATSFLAEVRQKSFPASATPVPTNLDNQDIVPMALMSGIRGRDQIALCWLVVASLAIGTAQLLHRVTLPGESPLWLHQIMDASPKLTSDRPLDEEVRAIAEILEAEARRHVG